MDRFASPNHLPPSSGNVIMEIQAWERTAGQTDHVKKGRVVAVDGQLTQHEFLGPDGRRQNERPESTVDFLGRSDWIVAWLGLAASDTALRLPKRIDQAGRDDIRSLRNAVRGLLSTATERHGRPAPSDVLTLNPIHRFGPVPVSARVDGRHPARSEIIPTGRGFDAVLTHLAIENDRGDRHPRSFNNLRTAGRPRQRSWRLRSRTRLGGSVKGGIRRMR